MSEHFSIEELLGLTDEDVKMSEKQKKVVEAAIEIFADKGFAAASTSEIAKKAGVAEGTIFRHYQTKKDLLFAIVKPTITKFAAPFLVKNFIGEIAKQKHEDPEQLMRFILENRFEFVRKNQPVVKILLQEVFFHEEFRGEIRKVIETHAIEKLRELIVFFQEKGEMVEMPPETVLRMIVTSIMGFLFARFILLPDLDWDDEAEKEYTIQFLLHGLMKK
ncbi:TetR/AcrR family transcriptional regulator [Metabacillus indicus]|uniref:TetR/AcrR family transcriptional regulator n=1 Tax=Metabacillus indicus TaxID=246786 RepID=UPI002A06991E|nr:TetR/AcrR family transcriptional regulator [Metabacillus indicus]MDX8291874.1 TetR/AcrR family transcriptional regulator [Metabacillus indicus]